MKSQSYPTTLYYSKGDDKILSYTLNFRNDVGTIETRASTGEVLYDYVVDCTPSETATSVATAILKVTRTRYDNGVQTTTDVRTITGPNAASDSASSLMGAIGTEYTDLMAFFAPAITAVTKQLYGSDTGGGGPVREPSKPKPMAVRSPGKAILKGLGWGLAALLAGAVTTNPLGWATGGILFETGFGASILDSIITDWGYCPPPEAWPTDPPNPTPSDPPPSDPPNDMSVPDTDNAEP